MFVYGYLPTASHLPSLLLPHLPPFASLTPFSCFFSPSHTTTMLLLSHLLPHSSFTLAFLLPHTLSELYCLTFYLLLLHYSFCFIHPFKLPHKLPKPTLVVSSPAASSPFAPLFLPQLTPITSSCLNPPTLLLLPCHTSCFTLASPPLSLLCLQSHFLIRLLLHLIPNPSAPPSAPSLSFLLIPFPQSLIPAALLLPLILLSFQTNIFHHPLPHYQFQFHHHHHHQVELFY